MNDVGGMSGSNLSSTGECSDDGGSGVEIKIGVGGPKSMDMASCKELLISPEEGENTDMQWCNGKDGNSKGPSSRFPRGGLQFCQR